MECERTKNSLTPLFINKIIDMIEEIDKKVQRYLMKEFPKKKLVNKTHLQGEGIEIYGVMAIEVRVQELPDRINYHIVEKRIKL